MKNIQRMVLIMVLVCWGMITAIYAQQIPLNNFLKEWDKTYGGTNMDQANISIPTKDGGSLITGLSSSNSSFEKSENSKGQADFWLLKIDANGKKQWDRTIGTTEYDSRISDIRQTSDGGYIFISSSSSNKSGDKSDNNASENSDIWVVKLDRTGIKQWDKTYGGTENDNAVGVVENSTGFLVVGNSNSSISGNKGVANKGGVDIWLIYLDNTGNKVWEKTLGGSSSDNVASIAKIDNDFILCATTNSVDGDNSTKKAGDWIIKVDTSGNKLWDKSMGLIGFTMPSILIDNENNIVISAYSRPTSNSSMKVFVTKLDKNGSKLWIKDNYLSGGGEFFTYKISMFTTEDNTINIGVRYVSDIGSNVAISAYLLHIVDKNGVAKTLININKRYSPNDQALPHLTYLGNNNLLFIVSDNTNRSPNKTDNSRGELDFWVTKFNITNSYRGNVITGNIYNDLNANCQPNPNEIGLKDILVRATPGNYNTFTDEKGNYTLYLDDIGTYTITPIIPTSKKNIITSACANTQTVNFTSLGNIKSDVNFGLKAPNCANLTVDITSNRRRRCFRNFTTVKYANEGYLAADNVQLKVIYPKYVVPIRSSTVWTSLQDSVITYNLGRLEAGQTGQIVITDSVVCGNESIRGLTQCTKAIISPKSTCVANNPNWDKADLQAFSQCVNATHVKLSVINTGEAMRDSTVWRLFLNVVLKQQGRLKLGKGENYSFEILAKGNTIRLEADQTPNHPVGQYALTTIERCGGVVAFNAVLPPLSVQLPININASGEEIATSCMPIIDSYDPNDNQIIPAGVGTSNIVRDADELEFQVRFQNTGSDTAYTVIIRDTLSTALDIASLQVGAASHKYTYTVSGKNNPIITWTFDNINLPAQKQNDLGSNGFVKFKIAQMPNNAKGTKIKNKAGIYFDFNSAIITNETNLTVGDLVSDLNNAADLATIFVCNNKPQPTSSQAGTDKITASDSLVLSANLAEKGTGIWKVVQGTGVFTNTSNPKTTVKKIGLGENIYEWSVSLCNTISASKVKITKVATPKAEITTKGDTLISEIADSYQWFLNGQAISGATSQSFIAKTNGTYTVEIKKFGVTVISPAFKHTITGIEDELLQKSTTLIPNPAQNTCVLQVRNDYFGEVKLSISNLLGQIVFQTVVDKNETNLSQSLDLQDFANGIYFVYLQTAKGKVVKKLVKM